MFLLRTHPARAAEIRYKMKLMTKRGADKPNPIAAILKFSFFSHLISPNTTVAAAFFFFKIKNCCYKNPQQASKKASSKRKPMRPKTHTHTHTQKRELERRQQQEFTAHTAGGGGGEAGRQAGKRDGRS